MRILTLGGRDGLTNAEIFDIVRLENLSKFSNGLLNVKKSWVHE